MNKKNVKKTSNNAPQLDPFKFKKGHPGGPGRPPGSRNKANLALEALGDDISLRAYKKLESIAFSDDPSTVQHQIKACSMLIEDTRGSHRSSLGTTLVTKTAADIVESENIVLDALGNGDIEPAHADSILKHLVHQRDFLVVQTLEEKINRIDEEAKTNKERGH